MRTTPTTTATLHLPGNIAARGFALFTALIFLLVMTLLGVAMYDNVVLQQKMAGNIQQKTMALSAADSATQVAENFVQGTNLPIESACSGQTTAPRICLYSTLLNPTADATWSTSSGNGVQLTSATFAGTVSQAAGIEGAYAAYPQYYVERIPPTPGNSIATGQQYGALAPPNFYRITAWGVGGNADAVAITRTLFIP
ncbi:MAG: pilus assembly PilX family protein [Gammaproteobacteria bacterium]